MNRHRRLAIYIMLFLLTFSIERQTSVKAWSQPDVANSGKFSFPFDENTGTTTIDQIQSLTGTFSTAIPPNYPQWITGDFGHALRFISINWVVFPDTGLVYGSGARSFFVWVRASTWSPITVLMYYGSFGGVAAQFAPYVDGAGQLHMNTFGDDCNTGLTVGTNAWHLVGVTIPSGSKTVTGWLDKTSATCTLANVPNTIPSDNKADFNGENVGGAAGCCTGNVDMDQAEYFNTDLNSSQESILFDNPTFVSVSPPTPPLNLVATNESADILLNWNTPASDGGSPITNYKVYRGSASGAETLLATLGVVLSYKDVSINVYVTYYYKVKATNVAGDSLFSNEAKGVSPPPSLDLTALALVIALTALAMATMLGSRRRV